MTVFGNEAFAVPEQLVTSNYLVRPLLTSHNDLDHAAVMATRDSLRLWEQSTWPEDDFSPEQNMEDMQKAELWRTEGRAYMYTVLAPDESECLGCIYVWPRGAKWLSAGETTALGGGDWQRDVEACVLFWVRESRIADGLDRTLLSDLKAWFDDEWSFDGLTFMTSGLFEQQIAMFEAAGLQRRFSTQLSEDIAPYLSFS